MDKKTSNRCIIVSSIIVCALVVTIFFYFVAPVSCLFGGNYYHEPSSPLHDAVVLYYQNKKREAKQLLLKVANDKKYTGGAYINYGMFLEREGDVAGAEDYYRKALGAGEHVALLYIFAMHSKSGKEFPRPAMTAAGNLAGDGSAYWLEYLKGEEKLLRGDVEGAIQFFEKAVALGLPDLPILYVDPLFQPLIKDPRFQAIKMKARTNYRTYRQIEKAVEEEALQFYKEKPFGMMKALYKIIYDPLHNENKDEKAFLELLRVEENVRDRAVALYRLARIRAKHKDTNGAKKYLDQFKELIASDKIDRTGFVEIVKKLGDDLFINDPFLKDIK